MHPVMQQAVAHWYRASRRSAFSGACAPRSCGPASCAPVSCAPGGGGWGDHRRSSGADGDSFDDGGSGFGVRRPLRFLAHKLELDEKQVAELARIINELKTERAQAEVDRRRTVTALADAVASDEYQEQHTAHAGMLRVQSAERLQQAIANALKQIHGVLDTEQRARFAYLIRSGTLSL